MKAKVVALKPVRPHRAHYTVPIAGCACSRCIRLRRAEYLRDVIALYEARLVILRQDLDEVSR